MRTPKNLVAQKVIEYKHECESCINCGTVLAPCNYVSGSKTVQTVSEIIKISYRPMYCAQAGCKRHELRLCSGEWQQIAPRNSTYGFDVIAKIGWERQQNRHIYKDIHRELSKQVEISESQVAYLYNMQYLPLIACNERQDIGKLNQLSATHGLILTLDGLAPEGGEPQLWLVRELQSGMTIRSGWMSEQSQKAFENFLRPIVEQEWDVKAILSDKQRGLLPGIKSLFPEVPHAYCQAHYLSNIAEPIASLDEKMKVALRKTVREKIGAIIRPEQAESPGVLTVTGLLPSPVTTEQPSTSPLLNKENHDAENAIQRAEKKEIFVDAFPNKATAQEQERDEILTAFKRRIRYLLTLKGRPPFRLAGIEMFQRLTEVLDCLDDLLAHIHDDTLSHLHQGLQDALALVKGDYLNLAQAEIWLRSISSILDPEDHDPRSGQQVKTQLMAYLKKIRKQSQDDPILLPLVAKIYNTTCRYNSGLFHAYDIPELHRTNNDRESEFRDLNRRLLRTTGQKGGTKRIILRSGAWELIPAPDTFDQTVQAISQVQHDHYKQERQRISGHRERFTLHTRSPSKSQFQLQALKKRWLRLSPD